MYLRRVKILGYYILAVCVMQIAIYLLLALSKGSADWLIYFDPRLGLFYFESGLRGKEAVAPTLVRWFSALWMFGLALLLLAGRRLVRIYIVSELVLSLPNVLFVVAIVWANLSPAHGFSIGELLVPLMVMLVFSAVPLGVALWVQKSKWAMPGFHSGRAEQALGADSP
jgi:hypothetical protein